MVLNEIKEWRRTWHERNREPSKSCIAIILGGQSARSKPLGNSSREDSWGQTAQESSCKYEDLEGWDREGGRETQEGGDTGIYVCV